MNKMKDKLKQFYKDSQSADSSVVLSDAAKQNVKDKIFSNLGSQAIIEEAPASAWSKLRRTVLRGYILAPLVILLFVTGTTIASADALPGDPLYAVKRQVENARLFIAPTEEAKLDLQVNFAQKRLDEDEKINKPDNNKNELQVNEDANNDSRRINKENEKSDNNDGQDQRHTKSREQADKALEFLNRAKQNWQQKGKEDKAHEIEDKVNKFREGLEKRSDWEQNRVRGEVRGDRTNIPDSNSRDDFKWRR